MFYLSEDFFRDDLDYREVVVSIRCIAFNQEKYIRDTLEGFVKQKTKFRFEAIVHDDCSTDGTASVIREYAEKYPSIIKPIFETENQYSKMDGSLNKIMNDHLRGKYIAFCEGDDYWTDPLKLQKQVDFLEAHPDYSMCVTNINIQKNNNTIHPSIWNKNSDEDLIMKDIILNGGMYIGTCSILLRREIFQQIPKEMNGLHVGDYPLQIFMGANGKVRQLKDVTCVYRYMSEGSWTQKFNKQENKKAILDYILKEQKLLDVMDKVTHFKYRKYFKEKSAYFKFAKMVNINKWCAFCIFLSNPRIVFVKFPLRTILYVCVPNRIIRLLRIRK